MNPNCKNIIRKLVILLLMAGSTPAHALPVGGVVAAGSAGISTAATGMTITQSTPNVAINWQSFGIGQLEAVRFIQPSVSSVALNRVLGANPSSILGTLSANGNVFLVNPNGILFGVGSSVNVGGLVASTRNISDGDFMAGANTGAYTFAGDGNGTIRNQGSLNADGGYVALLGAAVSNDGVISARLGTVALAAGNRITLDVAGDGLLSVAVHEGAVNALIQNGGLIQADGGYVLMTAQGAGSLLKSMVNNTGVIQAQTVVNHNGTIRLMGGMQDGIVNVSGTLDASAPHSGNGGFIETSAAHVKVADNAIITTQSAHGTTGTWLIDPFDFTIGNASDILGTTLSDNLISNSIVISTLATGTTTATNLYGTTGEFGDIIVKDAVTWSTPTTLTLNAFRNVNVNAAITTTGGSIVANAGGSLNANAAMTMTTAGGNIALNAAGAVNLNQAITTTNGNLTVNAGSNLNINGAGTTGLTTTDGRLVLSAGNDGTATGSLNFSATAPTVTVTGTAAVASAKTYTPIGSTTDNSSKFTMSGGATLAQFALVFAVGPTGPTGPVGPQGIQGIQGLQGVQGAVGNQGVKGDPGANSIVPGPAGAKGDQGVPGAASTVPGPVGANSTVAGPPGAKGDQGDQGVPGAVSTVPGPTGADSIVAGPPGAKGDQGATGSQGVIGLTGDVGATGSQGLVGLTGTAGAQGIQGIAGFDGATGVVGSAGAQGNQGTAGVQGATGAPGAQGNIGLTGAAGLPGSQGLEGIAGATGETGATGSQGLIGLTGAAGAQGIQGTAGLDGTTGAVGSAGAQGNQGTAGAQGITGLTGATGLQGNRGAAGSAGATGATGETGSQGVIGWTGLTGADGAQGSQGIAGLDGAVGASGIQGITGLTGAAGMQGVQGVAGLDGATGATGSQGLIGLTGVAGTTGSQGLVGLTGAAGAQGTQGIDGLDGATGAAGPVAPVIVVQSETQPIPKVDPQDLPVTPDPHAVLITIPAPVYPLSLDKLVDFPVVPAIAKPPAIADPIVPPVITDTVVPPATVDPVAAPMVEPMPIVVPTEIKHENSVLPSRIRKQDRN